jgi:glycosyltransferase involved in cell wall biosynthesis
LENRFNTRGYYNINENEIAIAIIGRLTKIKNHRFFIECIKKTKHSGISNFKVFIVGDGELFEEIRVQCDELNQQFGEFIFMTSWIKDIAKFNAGMDIICLTSDNEGTPVSLIEAQASNVAVMSTDVGGVRDIMLDGKTGYVVKKQDLDEYSEKLGILIKNKELRKEFCANGWEYVSDRFHFSRLAKEVESLYINLLNKVK